MLLGVWFYGWSAYSLLVLYWLETLVFGFWTIVMILVAPPQVIRVLSGPERATVSGPAIALFVVVHAGLFMAVHLFFLSQVFNDIASAANGSAFDTIAMLVVAGQLWVPLAGLFLLRGLATFDALRHGVPVERHVIGFYFRIVVMQLAIIGGGFLLLLTGTPGALLVLVVVRIAFELAIPSIEDYVEAHIEQLHNRKPGSTGV